MRSTSFFFDLDLLFCLLSPLSLFLFLFLFSSLSLSPRASSPLARSNPEPIRRKRINFLFSFFILCLFYKLVSLSF